MSWIRKGHYEGKTERQNWIHFFPLFPRREQPYQSKETVASDTVLAFNAALVPQLEVFLPWGDINWGVFFFQ